MAKMNTCRWVALGALLLTAASGCSRAKPYTPPSGMRQVSFRAADGVVVHAEYAVGKADRNVDLLLFHQANASSEEYYPVIPWLTSLGYECLAVNLRSGGAMFGMANPTATEAKGPHDYASAYQDMQAALEWMTREHPTATIVVVGSSYSASLAFRLAAENKEVAAVVAFSPGEYMPQQGAVRGWASRVSAPCFVTCNDSEVGAAYPVFSATKPPVPSTRLFFPRDDGVHGASALREDRNPQKSPNENGGYANTRKALADWLASAPWAAPKPKAR